VDKFDGYCVAIYIIYRVFTNTKLAKRLTNALRSKIVRKEIFKPVSFEELLLVTRGYGVSKIKVREGHSVLDRALSDSELRKDDITVLAIVRANETMPNPPSDTKIISGDELICFGKLGSIRKKFA